MSQPLPRGCESGNHRFVAVVTSAGSYLVCKVCDLRRPASTMGEEQDRTGTTPP